MFRLLRSPEGTDSSAVAEGEPSYEDIINSVDDEGSEGAPGAEGSSSPSSGTGTGGEATDAGGEDKQGASGPKAEGDTSSEPLAEPEDLKEVFKNPKYGKELRKRYYTFEEHENLFPLEEARELKNIIPDLEAARRLERDSETLAAFEQGLFSTEDNSVRQRMFEEIQKESPQAFASFAKAFPEMQYKLDKQSYLADTADRVKRTLINLARQEYANRNDEGVKALDTVSQLIFGASAGDLSVEGTRSVPDSKDARIRELEEKLAGRDTDAAVESFRNFSSYANDKTVDAIVGILEQKFDPLFPEGATDRVKKRMVGDAYSMIDQTLAHDSRFRGVLKQVLKDGNRDDAHFRRVRQLMVQRAKEVMPAAIQRVLEESKGLYSFAPESDGGRAEVGGGGAPSKGSKVVKVAEGQDEYDAIYDTFIDS